MRLLVPALLCLLVAVVLPSSASAARSCDPGPQVHALRLVSVTKKGTTCRTARQVAGGWINVTSSGESGREVFDAKGRRWGCRVTKPATGTDPGYNPYTHVKCTRRAAVVRFKVGS